MRHETFLAKATPAVPYANAQLARIVRHLYGKEILWN